jgi:hypothetical protein
MSETKRIDKFTPYTVRRTESTPTKGDSADSSEHYYTIKELALLLGESKTSPSSLAIRTIRGDREINIPSEIASNISKLSIDARAEENINYDFLRLFTSLENLTLRGSSKLTSLKVLENCTNLKVFYCDSESLVDINTLALCPALYTLTLSNCKMLTNLNGLENCPRLDSLVLRNCFVLTDIKSLTRLPALRSINLIDISALPSTQVSVLSTCPNLDEVSLSKSSSIQTLQSLSCPRLKYLKLHAFTGLTRTEGLQNCKFLETLSISNCSKLDDISSLIYLTSLLNVAIEHCDVLSNIRALSNMKLMSSLSLKGCSNIASVAYLGSCTNLTILTLESCTSLTTLIGLEKCLNLTQVTIDKCFGIADIWALAKNPKLLTLFRRDCPLLLNNADLDIRGVNIFVTWV